MWNTRSFLLCTLLVLSLFLLFRTYGVNRERGEAQVYIPAPYYNEVPQRYGIEELEIQLGSIRWSEGTYKLDEFDCSEMSAFAERWLENYGFHTYIVGTKGGKDKGHAWILVEVDPNTYIAVETTYGEIVTEPQYYEYDLRFETIQEAVRYAPAEFDWWSQNWLVE